MRHWLAWKKSQLLTRKPARTYGPPETPPPPATSPFGLLLEDGTGILLEDGTELDLEH